MFSLILCRRFCQNGRESDQLASLVATAIEFHLERRRGAEAKDRWPPAKSLGSHREPALPLHRVRAGGGNLPTADRSEGQVAGPRPTTR